jgi:hypothetical protein
LDNQSTIQVSRNAKHRGKIKDVALQMFWLQHAAEQGRVDVAQLVTDDMPADLLTKTLSREELAMFRGMIALVFSEPSDQGSVWNVVNADLRCRITEVKEFSVHLCLKCQDETGTANDWLWLC